jgi:iron complex outermembrane receptor protein
MSSPLRSLVILLALVALPDTARAQTGTITGTISAAESRTPISGARVQASGPSNGVATTREDGTYRIADLAPGTYSVVITRIGYGLVRVNDVRVSAGQTFAVDASMDEIATSLNQVVTTASRAPEKILDAPASIAVIDEHQLATHPGATVADQLKSLPGISVNSGGIAQSNIVARGFNNAFSGSMLMLQDYRFASVPSLRVNVPFLFTGTNEDVERIEVLLGPASALYGPNSANGVLHVITKSPFASQGTTLTVDGGERSLFRGAFRHATVVGDKVGFKLSGEYFRANDWTYHDPGEPATIQRPNASGVLGPVANARDFDLDRFSGEARMDIRPSANSELITTYGYSRIGSGLELTAANGTAQVRDWTYNSIQQRFRWNKLFAQVFANFSDAGNKDSLDDAGTFLLRSGQPIVDQSRVLAAQVQHGLDLGSRQSFVYGLDYIFTNPRTGGTINGRNENDDDVTEIGGYVQSTTKLSSKFDFLAALRLDRNDRIEGNQLSPRAALIFKPTETQNFRVTYNRAFNTPANFSYFLDLIQARNLGGLPYDIRAIGNPPKNGWQFNRSCDANVFGGVCMKSIFLPNTNQYVPASGALAFPGVIAANAQKIQGALAPGIQALLQSQGMPAAQAAAAAAGMAQQLTAYLGSLRPTAADIATNVHYILPGSPNLVSSDVRDLGPLTASFNNTYELGYKGILGKRARLAVDLWYQNRGDVGTTAALSTPNVYMDSLSLRAYLAKSLAPVLQQAGLSAPVAQAGAAQIAGAFTAGANNFGNLPVGLITFDSPLATAKDLIATYQLVQKKSIDVHGLDMAFDYLLTDRLTLTGTYSYVSNVIFESVPGGNGLALALNAPDHRASVAGAWRDEARGLGFDLRGRYTNAFPVNSGVYASGVSFPTPGANTAYSYEPVPVNLLVDAGFSWRLPLHLTSQQLTWSINATNIFDNRVPTFVGVPEIGRMVITRLQYQF